MLRKLSSPVLAPPPASYSGQSFSRYLVNFGKDPKMVDLLKQTPAHIDVFLEEAKAKAK